MEPLHTSVVLQPVSFLRWKQAFVSQFPRLIRREPFFFRLIHDEDRLRHRSIQALIKLSLTFEWRTRFLLYVLQ